MLKIFKNGEKDAAILSRGKAVFVQAAEKLWEDKIAVNQAI